MKTAVEFIESEVKMSDGVLTKGHLLLIIEQAKAMEKEQIIEAYTNALTGSIDPRWVEINKKQAEQYYNETFKS